MNEPAGQPLDRQLHVLGYVVAAVYALAGVLAMLLLSPRVPYADPWRFLAHFLSHGFPSNVVAADNGHREVLPNALRVFELHCCDANQWLQIGSGVALALVAFALALHALRALPAPQRALAGAAIAIGMFWLGNGRKLAHGNESVHLFLVQSFLLAGLLALTRTHTGLSGRRIAFAAGCGVLASLSFGAGLACFPAFAAVMVLQGASWRQLLPLAAAAALATACLLSGTEREAFEFAPVERTDVVLRWLGAPAQWAFSPFLDPGHAARLPTAFLRALTYPFAQFAFEHFGPRLTARWPACGFGVFAVVWLLRATWRAHRETACRSERVALGLAWFGLCVGALVAGLRIDYFRHYPKEITTPRYLPWSMLVWSGLVVVAVVRARSGLRAAWPVLLFAGVLAPSTVWTGRLAFEQRHTAEQTALGAAVGVLDRRFDLVETNEADLLRALPLLRDAGKAMFAWPETAWLGRTWTGTAPPIPLTNVDVHAVDNRLPGEGCQVSFLAEATAGRLLLLDKQHLVVGLAANSPLHQSWSGWLRGRVDARDLTAVELP